ncbi:MAG TPA: GTP-binding protein, partial [Chondromyces sp.]|nr:GTP-binding protein [Chondromyces sp.]
TPLKELLNGCICCTIQDQLESQLQGLLLNETFDDLIIEMTGAAHPVEAADAIMSPLFANHFEWKGIISIVDSFVWKKRSELSPATLQLLYEQVKHADLILLNKVDLITEMEQGILTYELQQINPHSSIFLTEQANIPVHVIENMTMREKGERTAVRADVHLNFNVMVYTFKKQVKQEAFENWVRRHVDHIYRMKGYVPFTHSRYPMMFQYSYGMPLYFPEEMNMPKNLVIIGEGLKKEEMIKELAQLENKAD